MQNNKKLSCHAELAVPDEALRKVWDSASRNKNTSFTKNLFRFEKKEIDSTFSNSQTKGYITGLKLLQAPVQNKDQEFGKLLIIASRKTGKACKRNKIRRQLRSIFYENKLYQKQVNSIIFIYKQALNLSFDNLKDFLQKNI
ncbi:MAG: hypothetical protein SZ59_C0005G0024 [candidate division TM6 bacterium GW2011_GWF2_28_16]|nr:MAG: hypothetical protein SZ59_C0005G0024 [candidate division TM6 bacterium GW2011_GWF2_28_16]